MPDSIARVALTLADRYRIERQIGSGGMATVHLAADLRHGRPVAIKLLRPALAAVLGRDRFLQEIQLAAQLQHPHILPLIDSGEIDGDLFYITPYVSGESLRQQIARQGRLPLAEALRLTGQIGDALGFAHRRGVIHRDVKPENILIQEGHALVADFGIALAVRQAGDQRLTQTGFSLGTPAYMSPEQVIGAAEIDGRSDQYSTACLFFEMVSGVPPFQGSTQQAVMAMHLTERAPVLDVPRPAAEAVARALSKDPAHRFEWIVDFVAALGRSDPSSGERAPPAAEPTTIVVLPFANRSPDPDTEYFSDGLTDEVISDLAKVRAIRVISRISAGQYKGTSKDAKTIARELAVRFVVSGTVRRAGDSLRVTAELVDSETDTVIWSEKFAGTMADVFAVQERLSREIVDALKVTVSPDESRRIAVRPMHDLRAYDCYLRARAEIYRFDPDALVRARAMVYEAMAIVGESAHLHATLAIVQWMFGNIGVQLDESSIAIGRAHADRAIALGPDVAAGYAAKGFIATKGKGGTVVAADHWLRRSLELERNPDALICQAWFLAERFGNREAIELGVEAAAVDPLNWFAICSRTLALLFGGETERARASARTIAGVDPTNFVALASEANFHLLLGDAEAAQRMFDRAIAQVSASLSASPMTRTIRALALAHAGDAAGAHALVDAAVREWLASDEWFCCWGVWLFAMMGDRPGALDWLGRAIDRGVTNTRWWSELDPLLAPYRADPEFARLMAKARSVGESPA